MTPRATVSALASCLAAALAACGGPRATSAIASAEGRTGMVVCEEPRAARAGADVLRRGGNAADAAVAAALALSVVHPQAGNLGGGGFALWVPRRGAPQALDFRETAPRGIRPELYLDASGAPDPRRSRRGPLAVGVPGSPAGLWEIHRQWGSGELSFADLARPAIELAREGFDVGADLARDLEGEGARESLGAHPLARQRFYPRGEPLRAGARLVQKDLADALERLAREGPEGFYGGPTARALVEEIRAAAAAAGVDPACCVTGEDLRGYAAVSRAPLVGWFRGQEVIAMPPPSSGGLILLQVLSVLDGFPLETERQAALAQMQRAGAAAVESDPSGVDVRIAHWWIEALRSAFAERAEHHGDPDFHPVPVERLLSAEWIASCRVAIGEEARTGVAPSAFPEGEETTHVSVVDESGNALSLTTTLNSSFGSGILVRGAGFLLNDELDDFALPDSTPNQFGLVGGKANAIEPGKRPLSSMTPVVFRDGGRGASLVLGSPGGPRIITAVVGVALRTLVFGQDLEAAVRAPRFHQQWSPPWTEFEPGWPPGLLEGLRRRGHDARALERRWGSVQAIRILPGGAVVGVSDPRSGGAAAR